MTYRYLEQYDPAISDFNKVLEIEKNHVDAYIERGIVYHRQGRYDDAIADFDMALKIVPGNSKAKVNRFATIWRKSNRITKYESLSDEMLFRNRLAEMESYGEREIAEIEEEMRIRGLVNDRSIEAFAQGSQRVRTGNFSLACEFYRRAIAISPRLPRTLLF